MASIGVKTCDVELLQQLYAEYEDEENLDVKPPVGTEHFKDFSINPGGENFSHQGSSGITNKDLKKAPSSRYKKFYVGKSDEFKETESHSFEYPGSESLFNQHRSPEPSNNEFVHATNCVTVTQNDEVKFACGECHQTGFASQDELCEHLRDHGFSDRVIASLCKTCLNPLKNQRRKSIEGCRSDDLVINSRIVPNLTEGGSDGDQLRSENRTRKIKLTLSESAVRFGLKNCKVVLERLELPENHGTQSKRRCLFNVSGTSKTDVAKTVVRSSTGKTKEGFNESLQKGRLKEKTNQVKIYENLEYHHFRQETESSSSAVLVSENKNTDDQQQDIGKGQSNYFCEDVSTMGSIWNDKSDSSSDTEIESDNSEFQIEESSSSSDEDWTPGLLQRDAAGRFLRSADRLQKTKITVSSRKHNDEAVTLKHENPPGAPARSSRTLTCEERKGSQISKTDGQADFQFEDIDRTNSSGDDFKPDTYTQLKRDATGRFIRLSYERSKKDLCSRNKIIDKPDKVAKKQDLNGTDGDPMKCLECMISFSSVDCYNSHMARCHDESCFNFFCKDCGKTYAGRFSLRRHWRDKHKFFPYFCKCCGATFPQPKSCRKHEKLCFQNLDLSVNDKDQEWYPKGRKNSAFCRICLHLHYVKSASKVGSENQRTEDTQIVDSNRSRSSSDTFEEENVANRVCKSPVLVESQKESTESRSESFIWNKETELEQNIDNPNDPNENQLSIDNEDRLVQCQSSLLVNYNLVSSHGDSQDSSGINKDFIQSPVVEQVGQAVSEQDLQIFEGNAGASNSEEARNQAAQCSNKNCLEQESGDKIHHGQCGYCKNYFSNTKCLQWHVKYKHKKDFRCFLCYEKLQKKDDVLKHLEDQHGMSKLFCNCCGAICLTDADLEIHKQFDCSDVTKSSRHLCNARKKQPFFCVLCKELHKGEHSENLPVVLPKVAPSITQKKRQRKQQKLCINAPSSTNRKEKQISQNAFCCKICLSAFKKLSCYDNHIACCHSEVCFHFYCLVCGKQVATMEEIERHWSKKHNITSFFCKSCGKMYSCSQTAEEHERDCKQKVEKMDGSFSRVRKGTSGTEEEQMIHPCFCGCCGELHMVQDIVNDGPSRSNRKKGATVSIEKEFTRKKNFACMQCSQKFTSNHCLEQHIQLQHYLVCFLCKRRYQQRGTLVKHLLVNHGISPYACDICGVMTASYSDTLVHREAYCLIGRSKHHTDSTVYTSKQNGQRKSKPKDPNRILHPYFCFECKDAHAVSEEKKSDVVLSATADKEDADVCTSDDGQESEHGSCSSGTNDLTMEPFRQEQPFVQVNKQGSLKCWICWRYFKGEGCFNAHFIRKHTGKYIFGFNIGCPECSFCASRRIEVQWHVHRNHRIKQCICRLCHQRFSQYSDYEEHTKLELCLQDEDHKSETTFVDGGLESDHDEKTRQLPDKLHDTCFCHDCKDTHFTIRKRTDRNKLDYRVLPSCLFVEVGDGPYLLKCPLCSENFMAISCFKMHCVSTHEIVIGRKSDTYVACMVCAERFTSTVDLLNHLLKTHQLYPCYCFRCSKGFLTKNLLQGHTCSDLGDSGRPSPASNGKQSCERTKIQKSDHSDYYCRDCRHLHIFPSNDNKHALDACQDCKDGFTDKQCLKQHLLIKHSSLPVKQEKEICCLCNSISTSLTGLAEHLKTAHVINNMFCTTCNDTFLDVEKFVLHECGTNIQSHTSLSAPTELLTSDISVVRKKQDYVDEQISLEQGSAEQSSSDFEQDSLDERESLEQQSVEQSSINKKFSVKQDSVSEGSSPEQGAVKQGSEIENNPEGQGPAGEESVYKKHSLEQGFADKKRSIGASLIKCKHCCSIHPRGCLNTLEQFHPEEGEDVAAVVSECNYCAQSFELKACLQSHMLREHVDIFVRGRLQIYQCVTCDQYFSSYENLCQHLNSDHRCCINEIEECREADAGKSLVCRICDNVHVGSLYTVPDGRAEREAREIKRSVCSVCEKFFTGDDALGVHMIREHKTEYYSCFVCKSSCSTSEELFNHLSCHMTDDPILSKALSNSNDKETLLNLKNYVSFPCKVCGKVFQGLYKLHAHFRRRHSLLNQKLFKCEVCNTKIKNRGHFLIHVHNHEQREKNFSCPECDYKNHRKGKVTEHFRLVHEKEKNFQCSQCGKKFAQTSSLKMHVETHNEEKSYICSVCGKAFKGQNSLKQHMVSHGNVKKYQCTTCGKRFSHAQHLKQHQVMHTDRQERKYECDLCGYKFGFPHHLRNHKKAKHAGN